MYTNVHVSICLVIYPYRIDAETNGENSTEDSLRKRNEYNLNLHITEIIGKASRKG